MQPKQWLFGCIAAAFLAFLSVGPSVSASWSGTYVTEDTKGNTFTIVLSADGAASGEKHGTVLKGTWSDDGEAAVIKWTTGWTTKLNKNGDAYQKSAFRPGSAMDKPASSPTAAKKVN